MTVNSDSEPSSTRAILIFSTYLSINTVLTLCLLRLNHRSYSRLPSPNKTAVRSRLLAFSVLAVASLGVTWYHMLSFFSLSYRSWAFDNNVQLPSTPTSWGGILRWLDDVRLGAWLKDVKLFRDAWETVVETEARKVWSLPIFSITAAWSAWIAREAHRRRIQHGWAYMVLGQLVAISFAMNLFNLAVLVHPALDGDVPGQKSDDDRKTSDTGKMVKERTSKPQAVLWTPPALVYYLILPATFYGILRTAAVAGEEHFLLTLAVPHVLLLLPPILQHIIPTRLGTKHLTSTSYDAFYRRILEAAVLGGLYIEATTLYSAIYTNTSGNTHSHRHSNVYMYPWKHEAVTAGETSFQILWRSLFDHPAVSSVGWDSILCTISFVTWKLTTS